MANHAGYSFFIFALPDHKKAPPERLELLSVSSIALDVPIQFGVPVFLVGIWAPSTFAIVAMPETAVYLNGNSEPRENEVGPPWQFIRIKAIAEAGTKKLFSDGHFRRSIP